MMEKADIGIYGLGLMGRNLAVALGALTPQAVGAALLWALAYYDGLRTAWSGAGVIQRRRDLFGAHGFERADRPGTFHLAAGS